MHSSFYYSCAILLVCFSYYISIRYPFFPKSSSISTAKSANLTSSRYGYLVDVRVGSKSLKQSLFMDTGSSLLWINCDPCQLDAPEPLFNPKTSTSFETEDCVNSDICRGTGAVRVGPCKKQRCMYEIQYGRGNCKGYLGQDTVRFANISSKIVFGCARESAKFDARPNGVLGLGSNKLSLISQLNASRFSYCFGNISDAWYAYNFLSIGDDCTGVSGYRTRLLVEDKYFINLESIRVGDKLLDIDREVFKRNSDDYTGGMMVDTGSTYTYIPLVALKKLQKEVVSLINSAVPRNRSIKYRDQHTMLCYNGVLTRDLKGFPRVQLTFEGGAVMELTAENVFYQLHRENFCLAVLPSELLRTTSSILGNLMQQFFYICFDMELKEFKFRNVDCATFIWN